MRYLACILLVVGCNTHQIKSVPTPKPQEPPKSKVLFSVPELSDDAYHVYVDPPIFDQIVKDIHAKVEKFNIGPLEIHHYNIKNQDQWDGPVPINCIKLIYPIVVDEKWYLEIYVHKVTKSQEKHKPEIWVFLPLNDTKTEKWFADAGELPFTPVFSTDDPQQSNTTIPIHIKSRTKPWVVWGDGDYPDQSKSKYAISTWADMDDLVRQFHKTRNPDTKAYGSVYAGKEIRFGWPWYEGDHRGRTVHTSVHHLITVHGYTAEALAPYAHNGDLLDRIHGYAHTGQGTVNP